MDLSNFPQSSALITQLSDDMVRLAESLANLVAASTYDRSLNSQIITKNCQTPLLRAELIRKRIRERRIRAHFFKGELFADPAWDMLLDLFHAELTQQTVSVTSLCIASNVPGTTALRWIGQMVEMGLLTRRPDPRDARRIFVELTCEASKAMHRYFDDVSQPS